MPIVEVPGQGQVQFPDDMSDDQIAAAIKANMPQQSVADKLIGGDVPLVSKALGTTGPRYQTWPERLIRSVGSSLFGAATLPGDVLTGKARLPSSGSVPGSTEFGAPDSAGLRVADLAFLANPINPAVRAGDMAIPGLKMAPTTPVKPGAPSTTALKESADSGYKTAAEIPLELRSSAVANEGARIQRILDEQGRNGFAPETYRTLEGMQKPAPGSFATGQDLERIRQTLRSAAQSADKREASAASAALREFESFRGALPEADILAGSPAASQQAFRNARGDYAAAQRSNKITGELDNAYTGVIDRGELNASVANSGANVGNSIRQQAKALLKNRRELKGFSPDEIAQLERVAEGTVTGNLSRRMANVLGGGGGMWQGIVGAGGAATGAVAGGPLGAAIGGVAGPMAGMALKATENASVRRQARLLDEMIRQRSPLYEQMLQNAPRETASDLRRSGLLRALLLNRPEAIQQ